MAQRCPSELESIGNTVYTAVSKTGTTITFKLCGTLDNGCATPGGGQICKDPGCCSICQRWGQNGPNEGAACLGGQFMSHLLNATMFVLYYTYGDPVYDGVPPSSRETNIVLSCGGLSPIGDWKFIDATEVPRQGNVWMYSLSTATSLCAAPGNGKLDPGYPFSITVPGYYARKTSLQKGAAIAVSQPNGLYTLNITVLCGTSCLFKTLLLDSSNMQKFLTDQPFVCRNDLCNQLWGQYHFEDMISASGSQLYVLVLPQGTAVLSVQVAALLAIGSELPTLTKGN